MTWSWESLVANTLPWWAWTMLALVPPAIIALYFLKLVRQPLEVPSTYLWHKTVEDLHVNSLWQQLRQNILLLLQLLVLLFAILACLRLGCSSSQVLGKRFVFLIDASASMQATDTGKSRLDVARQKIEDLIERMEPGAVAMLISFSDNARVEQSFTDNRTLLRQKLAEVRPTNRLTNIGEALQAAAGLANPGRAGDQNVNKEDVAAAEALPATVYVVSDGGFPPVPKFQQGNLTINYLAIGNEEFRNIGIAAFSADRNAEKITQLQAFARLENYGSAEEKVQVALYVDGSLRDAKEVAVRARGSQAVDFDLGELLSGKLKLVIEHPGGKGDDLAADDTAYAALDARHRTRVLLVTPRNDALTYALGTKQAQDLAEVAVKDPGFLASDQYKAQTGLGMYDLIIFDQCAPEKMPQASTLFVGRLPPGGVWKAGKKYAGPEIIDIDRAHPLMQFVEMGNVKIAEAQAFTGPPGTVSLIDGDTVGSLFAIAPRDGFEDCVMGFELYGTEMKEGKAERYANTDWPIRLSFPLFIRNLLDYFGSGKGATASQDVLPGATVMLRTETPVDRLRITLPSLKTIEVSRGSVPTFSFSSTDELGLYDIMEGKSNDRTQHLAVNLFDMNESDLQPRKELNLGSTTIKKPASAEALEPARAESWRWLLLIGFIVLILEWYIYNKRVYM